MGRLGCTCTQWLSVTVGRVDMMMGEGGNDNKGQQQQDAQLIFCDATHADLRTPQHQLTAQFHVVLVCSCSGHERYTKTMDILL